MFVVELTNVLSLFLGMRFALIAVDFLAGVGIIFHAGRLFCNKRNRKIFAVFLSVWNCLIGMLLNIQYYIVLFLCDNAHVPFYQMNYAKL